jgi:hypothetical protein
LTIADFIGATRYAADLADRERRSLEALGGR